MRKRAALARAIALDPNYLFFDEPSAGLDPVSSQQLDDLILQLRDTLGATIVVVSHELASIFSIADHAVYLDAETRTMTDQGRPSDLLENRPILSSGIPFSRKNQRVSRSIKCCRFGVICYESH